MFFIFIFVIFLFVFPDRWETGEICQKRIRGNTAVFMTSYIILIKLSGVQFGRNITWPRDLKIRRARSASSITNKYDYKQKLRVSRSPINTLLQPFWNRKFSQHQYFIDYFTYYFVCKTEVMPFKACLQGGGVPQESEVTRICWVTHLSIWSLILIWSHLHNRWGDPPRFTSPPCKQALRAKMMRIKTRNLEQ